MDSNLRYYLTLSFFLGIGPIRFDALMKKFGNVRDICDAKEDDLRKILGPTTLTKFIQFRNTFNVEKEIEYIKKQNITVLTREDKRFPQQLREISDSPICLYVKGDVSNFDFKKDKFFAIVGTRLPTSYGIQVTRQFASELAASGVVIVSGLAMGVDAIAHKAALDVNGKTIAFLGCGVDIAYPPANKNLYHEIIGKGGLVISEFPPQMTVLKGFFVARNRLISGLSQGVMVTEGIKHSGSLITARNAAEQGKDVYAVPAPINSQMSEAPNLLLKEGAKMVTTPQDILEDFNLTPVGKKGERPNLSADEEKIYNSMLNEVRSPDEVSVETKLPIYKVLSLLSTLEIQGVIEKNIEGKYQISI